MQSIVSEACGFFQYAQQLFGSDSLAGNLRFQHLHMYIHRIALSVILPPRPRPQYETQLELPASLSEGDPQASSKKLTEKIAPSADKDLSEATPTTKVATPTKAGRPASRKLLLKQATFAVGFSSGNNNGKASSKNKLRPRSESLDVHVPLPPSSLNTNTATVEGTKGVGHQSGKSRRAQWTKQQSIQSDRSTSIKSTGSETGRRSDATADSVDGFGRSISGIVGGAREREWRGLNLDLLRSRIQRLMVVMNTSEPGSVPDAGMLASLVDLVSAVLEPSDYIDL